MSSLFRTTVFFLTSQAIVAYAQSYTATYLPSNAPAQSEQGQTGTNQCGTGSSQTSNCQNAFINSVTDFCLWAPPNPGADSTIGETEQIEVAWCMKAGYGTRLIPDGTIQGAHFVQTPDYVQITGVGDFTKMNIPASDEGGELDPHGADGNGNPIGGLIFGSSFGSEQQYHEWTNFMSATEFCFRACKDGPNAAQNCQHIYDLMGCDWNMPANYNSSVFENCVGDSSQPMGVYTDASGAVSTFQQGDAVTPSAHPIPSSSSCTSFSTISNGLTVSVTTSSTASHTTATGTVRAGSNAPSGSRSNSAGTPAATNTSSASSQFTFSKFGWQKYIFAGIFLVLGSCLIA